MNDTHGQQNDYHSCGGKPSARTARGHELLHFICLNLGMHQRFDAAAVDMLSAAHTQHALQAFVIACSGIHALLIVKFVHLIVPFLQILTQTRAFSIV